MTASLSSHAFRLAGRHLRRVVACLCVIVFALQLLLAAGHHHDAGEAAPDCVSCQVASQSVGDLPGTPAAVLAVLLLVAYVLALRPSFLSPVVPRYLIPPRQAPPRH